MGFLLIAGCGADFEDLRPPSSAALDFDAGMLGSFDLGSGDAASGTEVLLSTGVFEVFDYNLAGSAEVYRRADGRLELRLGAEFRVDPLPGPVVVFSNRERLGPRIQPEQGDIRIGALQALRGAQNYLLPEAAGNAAFVNIYCEPFGLDVGVAALTPGG